MLTLGSDTLVLASHNAGKLREIADLLAPFGLTVRSAASFGLEEPAETEDSFEGNARIKAHVAAKGIGLPALSDDSGLEVEALDGAPGVYTADWAETPTGRDFDMAMEKLWQRVQETGAADPLRARFVCVLCLAWPDGSDRIYRGAVEGVLVWPKRGARGFGFDPMFQPVGETETFGEMDPSRKHEMSHRAVAFGKLVADILGR
ncbi:non-canonical purine NTP pyrophosphatase [Halovulum dunhuangense]|uniref:dITP/XTP pyrophosphatase n=1 Tax=Halovulum dunhuangense TaxID=1505036 RepID=A0A849KYB7_9RHOB|nr:non-canonical purine NTP pyrophosphatase [Halovulum dunhuangense]NNU79086.1 non-canonical purine NTP pyrophosphatase [Halovulum dunhuangense]